MHNFIVLLNKSGSVLASSKRTLIGRSLSDNRGFRKALSGKLSVQDVAFNKLAGEYDVIIAVPIKAGNGNGDVSKVLLAALSWNTVNSMINDLLIGGQNQTVADHIMLTNKAGLVISCFDRGEMFKKNLIKIKQQSALFAKEGKEGTIYETSIHGLPSFSTYSYSMK